MHLGCERDGLAFSKVEPRLNKAAPGPQSFKPTRADYRPVLDRHRRQGMLELCQHGKWSQNPRG
jgi:hypothetical protein